LRFGYGEQGTSIFLKLPSHKLRQERARVLESASDRTEQEQFLRRFHCSIKACSRTYRRIAGKARVCAGLRAHVKRKGAGANPMKRHSSVGLRGLNILGTALPSSL
jgi:hypothetical protein